MSGAHVDHVAIRVRNFEWYLDFFQNMLGMNITLTDPEDADPKEVSMLQQAWVGGIQLQRDETLDSDEFGADEQKPERLTHIGIAVENAEELLDAIYAIDGINQAPNKPRNWFILPGNIMIELVSSGE